VRNVDDLEFELKAFSLRANVSLLTGQTLHGVLHFRRGWTRQTGTAGAAQLPPPSLPDGVGAGVFNDALLIGIRRDAGGRVASAFALGGLFDELAVGTTVRPSPLRPPIRWN